MTRSPKPQLLAAAVASLTLAVPAAAHAADAFVGVTGGDQLVHFTSDTIPGLSAGASIDGLPGGEHLVALDRGVGGTGSELIALGRSGTLYGLDAAHHKVTRTAGGFGIPILPGAPASLSVAPDGKSARVIASGHDRTVDLTSGAITADAPAAANVVVDAGADGVLRGIDPASNTVVSLDGAGEHALAPLALTTYAPDAVTTAADGALWISTSLAPRAHGQPQSRLLRYDPKTGQLRSQNSFLFQQLDAIAATGTAPDDTQAPKVSVHIPKQTLRDALKHRGYIAEITTSEPGQTVMSARVGSSYRAFGFSTAIHGGTIRVLASSKLSRIRATAGHRVRLHIAVHDWAGNTKVLDRYFTLARH
ncbi:MAG: hypothetical protein JWQ18_2860 [Conexibacter sp.]|nr:hypothetical protein [Conexibacter sp.]